MNSKHLHRQPIRYTQKATGHPTFVEKFYLQTVICEFKTKELNTISHTLLKDCQVLCECINFSGEIKTVEKPIANII